MRRLSHAPRPDQTWNRGLCDDRESKPQPSRPGRGEWVSISHSVPIPPRSPRLHSVPLRAQEKQAQNRVVGRLRTVAHLRNTML